MKPVDCRMPATAARVALFLWALVSGTWAAPAAAEPADYVHSPNVEAGANEIGIKYGTLRPLSRQHQSALAIGVGRGVTDWWSTEIYLSFRNGRSEGSGLEAVEWENTFSLLEEEDAGIALGFITELQHSRRRAEGNELLFGPLLQKHFGPVRVNLNLLLSREYNVDHREPMQLGYQFQGRYQLAPDLGIGMQAFGSMGKWNAWAPRREQQHRLGPALFGSFAVGAKYRFDYDAALLFEAANREKDRTLRMAIGYEF